MAIADTLIGRIHPALSTDPLPYDVIRLAPTVATAIDITAQSCTVYQDGGVSQTWDLASYTLAGLQAAFPGNLGASLLSTDWSGVRAVALIPTTSPLTLAAGQVGALSAYTAPLWRVARPIGAQLDALQVIIDQLVAQTDIRQAVGGWLDLWGLVWALPRLADETDDSYRQRVIFTLTLPRANNRALEALIRKALGRSAIVSDGGLGGVFTWNGANTWGPTGTASVVGPQSYGSFVVTLDADDDEVLGPLIALIQQYKAAGTSFTINTRYAPEGTMTYSDMSGTAED